MKTQKWILTAVVSTSMIFGTVAFADTLKTPAQILSELTGKPVSELYTQRSEGKTYGTLAQEAGKLDAFKAEMLAQKKAILAQRVKDGTMTQAQADAILAAIEKNQTTCTGNGQGGIGRTMGAGFGMGMGMGSHGGGHSGSGYGSGFGGGMHHGIE